MNKLLNPKSIAVIGASREKGKLGRLIFDNIINGGFQGPIYPVNPKSKEIGGKKCHKSVLDIKKDIDLAIVVIPSKFVKQIVKECIEKGIGGVVIISSGFSETGQKGLAEEHEIVKLVEGTNTKILGPNCLGLITTSISLNATFAKTNIPKGNIAFMSQSGALGSALLDWAEKSGIGLSHFVSLGNKADLSENEFLNYFSADDNVRAIALYLEDFVDGKKFMRLAEKVNKPILLLKPGKSKAAQKALGSHTGSLAQDDKVIDSAMKQCGVVRVQSMEELFNSMMLFSWGNINNVKSVAIVTNAGGPGVITTDKLSDFNLEIAKLESGTKNKLKAFLPDAASCENPVDVLGDAKSDRYSFALKTIEGDNNVDLIMVLLTPQVMTDTKKTAREIVTLAKKSDKNIIVSFIGGEQVLKARKILYDNNIPTFAYPGDATVAISSLMRHRNLKAFKGIEVVKAKNGQKAKPEELISTKSGSVDTQTAEKILLEYGIPLVPSNFPTDIADLRRSAAKLGYPLVLKLTHPDLLHKTEIKAVRVGISDDDELESEYEDLKRVAEEKKLEGYKIEVQKQIKNGLELIIGVKRHDDEYVEVGGERVLKTKGFGHSLIFGSGGIYAEVFNDVALRVLPVGTKDVKSMVDETFISKVLKGARRKNYDVGAINEIIRNIARLVSHFPQIAELDVNPLFATEKGAFVADVKMIIK